LLASNIGLEELLGPHGLRVSKTHTC
jgi:hypothetical protein